MPWGAAGGHSDHRCCERFRSSWLLVWCLGVRSSGRIGNTPNERIGEQIGSHSQPSPGPDRSRIWDRTSSRRCQRRRGSQWRILRAVVISRSTTVQFSAPASPQQLTLRVQLVRAGHVRWQSRNMIVNVRAPTGSPTAPAGTTTSPTHTTPTGTITTPTTTTPNPDQGSSLTSGESLQPGQYLQSPNGSYELIMQADGNLVLYQGTVTCPTASCNGDALWNSGTGGDNDAYVTMQSDGNLVVYDNGTAVWSSQTAGFPGDYLQLTGRQQPRRLRIGASHLGSGRRIHRRSAQRLDSAARGLPALPEPGV